MRGLFSEMKRRKTDNTQSLHGQTSRPEKRVGRES